MSQNDKKIKDLLDVINAKKKTIGIKPKAAWKTNGVLKHSDGTHTNINTVNTLSVCVAEVAYLMNERNCYKDAAIFLEVPYVEESSDLYLEDFKLRASMIKWDEEKRKLDLLEKKLKDLRSEDAKTEDALSDIMAELK